MSLTHELNNLTAVLMNGQPLQGTDETRRIVFAVCQFFGVTPDTLFGKRGTRTITTARHVLIYALRERCGMSYPELGEFTGRNHQVAMHSVRRVRDALDNIRPDSQRIRAALETIEREFDERGRAKPTPAVACVRHSMPSSRCG